MEFLNHRDELRIDQSSQSEVKHDAARVETLARKYLESSFGNSDDSMNSGSSLSKRQGEGRSYIRLDPISSKKDRSEWIQFRSSNSGVTVANNHLELTTVPPPHPLIIHHHPHRVCRYKTSSLRQNVKRKPKIITTEYHHIFPSNTLNKANAAYNNPTGYATRNF